MTIEQAVGIKVLELYNTKNNIDSDGLAEVQAGEFLTTPAINNSELSDLDENDFADYEGEIPQGFNYYPLLTRDQFGSMGVPYVPSDFSIENTVVTIYRSVAISLTGVRQLIKFKYRGVFVGMEKDEQIQASYDQSLILVTIKGSFYIGILIEN
jgi:hypothetical protein